MNKKEFIRNRPFDEVDAMQMQDWIEKSIQDLTDSVLVHGIINGMAVSLNNGMALSIGLGKAIDINNKFIIVPSNQSVTLQNGHTTFDRYDVVTIKYTTNTLNNTDTANKYNYGTSFIYSKNILDSFVIEVIQGTPSSSPSVPSIPSQSLKLAEILVPALATSILPENIVDKRQFISLSSFVVGSTEPTEIAENKIWVDTTTYKIKVWQSGQWITINARNADTVSGRSVGTAANNILLLDNNGKVPSGNLSFAGSGVLDTIARSDHTHDQYLQKSGGTMTDFLTLHANPTSNLHAATKQYVDTQFSLARTYA